MGNNCCHDQSTEEKELVNNNKANAIASLDTKKPDDEEKEGNLTKEISSDLNTKVLKQQQGSNLDEEAQSKIKLTKKTDEIDKDDSKVLNLDEESTIKNKVLTKKTDEINKDDFEVETMNFGNNQVQIIFERRNHS